MTNLFPSDSADLFRHQTPVQLRFKDTDLMGHVNNANHLTYMELARVHYFNDVVSKNNNWLQTGFILAKINIEYIKPVFLTDTIIAFTRCTRLGNKSFDLDYELRSLSDDNYQLMAKGLSTVVCYNYELKETILIPDEWRKKIMAFEEM